MTTREACARHLADWWDHQEAGLKLFLEGRLTPKNQTLLPCVPSVLLDCWSGGRIPQEGYRPVTIAPAILKGSSLGCLRGTQLNLGKIGRLNKVKSSSSTSM